MEGINNKIKVLRRQVYGLPDDDYFFLRLFDASRKDYIRNPLSHKICDWGFIYMDLRNLLYLILTDIGLMIVVAKRMTAQSATPSSTIKEETSLSQSLCKPGCNLPGGVQFQSTMASGRNERGCISFYNWESFMIQYNPASRVILILSFL